MSLKDRLRYQAVIIGIVVICLFFFCKECNNGMQLLLKNKIDTVYITKPKMVDILRDTQLVNQLKKIFGKRDSFVITKYIPVKVKIRDTLLIPERVTDTVYVVNEDTVMIEHTHFYKKQNKDSTFYYGFLIKTNLLGTKDTVKIANQYMKDMYMGLNLNIYEVKRIKKFGFTERMISITHPKEISVECKPYYVKDKIKRLGFGVFAGAGVAMPEIKPKVVFGLGLNYNLFLIK